MRFGCSPGGIVLSEREELPVVSRIRCLRALLSDRAAAGEPAFVKMVEEGHLDHYRQEIDFLEKHVDDWNQVNPPLSRSASRASTWIERSM